MRVLIDTNILVRSVQRNHPRMSSARRALHVLIQQGYDLCVTPQNIAEFWNVCTRPIAVNRLGNSIGETDRLTAQIETFFTVLPDFMEAFRLWRRLIVTHEVKGAKVHDARIAAVMLALGITQILSFNLEDFKRYAPIIAVHPEELQ